MFYRLITDRKRFRVVLFFLFAFCILVVSLTYFALSIGKPYMGAMLFMNNEGWSVGNVDANGLAIQAGIQEGDRPIEVNGQQAETFLEKYRRAGVVFGQLIRELTVIDDSGQLKSVALQESSPPRGSVVELTTWFIVCSIFWITGFYVFFKRPRNIAALLLCISGLVFGLALSGQMAAIRAIPISIYFEISASVIGPWLLLHFFLVLPEERTWLRNNPLVYLIYILAAITLILFPLIGYANGQPVMWFRTFRLFGYVAGFLLATGVLIFNYFHSASIKTRQQMKIVLIGCLAAIVPFLLFSLLPEAILGQTFLPSGFGILFVAFIPLGMGYAVVTKKLMDIDLVIRRSVVYSLITIIMATVLSAAIFTSIAFHESLGIAWEVIIAIALGGIAVVLFDPVKKWIELLIDKLFYKDRYDYRQIIQSLSTSLSSLMDFVDISRLVVGTTVNTLNLAGSCLFVKAQSGSFEVSTAQGIFTDTDKQKELLTLISTQNSRIEFPNSVSNVDPDVAFLIPLVAGEKKVGILCLSQKNSRQDFSSNDMFLLQGLASIAAVALHSAMLIRDVSMRDTFVSVASHELRTPLTSILGYAELLLRRDRPRSTQKRWLRCIFDNGQRIAVMVDDLLTVSRIQSGKISIKLERVKLSDVLRERLAIIGESTSKHEFIVNIEPDLPDVLVDRDKFGQVVINLLSNAVKYSPNGGHITLSAYNDLQRHCIVVSIADEGIGISQKDKDLLCTTFHRIQRSETRDIRGSGLGLYIAKEWIEAMGGEIWLESELNKGSTFFVSIPMYDSKVQTERFRIVGR